MSRSAGWLAAGCLLREEGSRVEADMCAMTNANIERKWSEGVEQK